MSERVSVIVAAALLSACAATTDNWTKPGMSLAQVQQDINECKYEADKATQPTYSRDPLVGGIADGMRLVSLRDQCLQIRGYSKR